jgi:hypothetical protein
MPPAIDARLELILLAAPNQARTLAQGNPIASEEPAAVPPRQAPAEVAAPKRPISATKLFSAPIDWASEAKSVALASAARQAQSKPYRSFSAHVMALAIPDSPATQRDGASQFFEGGEVISWVSDRCFYTNHGWEPYQVVPSVQKVCKDSPRRE